MMAIRRKRSNPRFDRCFLLFAHDGHFFSLPYHFPVLPCFSLSLSFHIFPISTSSSYLTQLFLSLFLPFSFSRRNVIILHCRTRVSSVMSPAFSPCFDPNIVSMSIRVIWFLDSFAFSCCHIRLIFFWLVCHSISFSDSNSMA